MWFNVRDHSIPSASVTPSLKWERFPLCGVTSCLLGLNVLSVVMLIYPDPGRPRSPSRFMFPASLPSPPHLPNCFCWGCKHLTEQGWQIIFNRWTCNKSLRELRGLCMGSNVPALLCVKFWRQSLKWAQFRAKTWDWSSSKYPGNGLLLSGASNHGRPAFTSRKRGPRTHMHSPTCALTCTHVCCTHARAHVRTGIYTHTRVHSHTHRPHQTPCSLTGLCGTALPTAPPGPRLSMRPSTEARGEWGGGFRIPAPTTHCSDGVVLSPCISEHLQYSVCFTESSLKIQGFCWFHLSSQCLEHRGSCKK